MFTEQIKLQEVETQFYQFTKSKEEVLFVRDYVQGRNRNSNKVLR